MSTVNRTVCAGSGRAVLLLEAILVSLALLAAPCLGQQFENDKLLPADGVQRDYFGISVALSGDRALIGAYGDDENDLNAGSAYVFAYDSISGTWHEEAKLVASDGAKDAHLGFSPALFGDRALIGAYGDDDNGYSSGSAYVFAYDGISRTWHEEAKLVASDGDEFDRFGYSVALHGTRAIASAIHDDDNGAESGAVYVFAYDSISGTWHEEAKLLASDGAPEDYFGRSVALVGDRALVGASGDDDNGNDSGSVYLFEYDSVSGAWHEEAKLLASDGAPEDYFGDSVALFGTRALIGAEGDDDNGHYSGSAYIFAYDSVSGTWHEEAKLLASHGAISDYFGNSVALSETSALIGAPGDDQNGYQTGSAYVFRYDAKSETWREEAWLRSSDVEMLDEFGTSVAVSGSNALVGAVYDDDHGPSSGSVYAFDFTSTLALDVKCNGQDQNVIVDSNEDIILTIDIDNGYHPDLKGDFWILVILPASGMSWTYGPWENPIWQKGAGNEYYTGPPLNHAAMVHAQPVPPGSYKLYLALDAIPNGVLDLSALWDFDVVDITVQ